MIYLQGISINKNANKMHFIFALNTHMAHMNRSEWRKFYFIFSKDIKLLSLSLLCNASYYLLGHINAVLFNEIFWGQSKWSYKAKYCMQCFYILCPFFANSPKFYPNKFGNTTRVFIDTSKIRLSDQNKKYDDLSFFILSRPLLLRK